MLGNGKRFQPRSPDIVCCARFVFSNSGISRLEATSLQTKALSASTSCAARAVLSLPVIVPLVSFCESSTPTSLLLCRCTRPFVCHRLLFRRLLLFRCPHRRSRPSSGDGKGGGGREARPVDQRGGTERCCRPCFGVGRCRSFFRGLVAARRSLCQRGAGKGGGRLPGASDAL